MLAVLLAFVLGQIVGPLHIEEEEDGPQIIFASTRDQVFYCDFSSPVCSDGRVITTTRSTPVPCETSPGVWEMVGPNEGCYNWRGELESWRQNTSYLAHGASPDQSNWDARSGTTVERVADWWRVSFPQIGSLLTNSNGRIASTGQSWTAACIAKQGPSGRDSFRMRPFHGQLGVSQYCNNIPLRAEWGLISCTGNVGDAPDAQPAVFLDPPSSFIPGDLEVVGCWLTKTDTPGRPCWDSEAPVTCGTDFHRMPSTLLPSTNGEISVSLTLHSPLRGDTALRGILWADGAPIPNRISIAEDGRIRVYNGTNGFFTSAVTWEVGRKYHVRVVISPEQWRVYRDGVLIGSSPSLGQIVWPASVRIADLLDGSISYLSVRNYE